MDAIMKGRTVKYTELTLLRNGAEAGRSLALGYGGRP